MPELPEVEITRRGIESHITNKIVKSVVIRTKKLRWEIPTNLNQVLSDQQFYAVTRRAKYLLLNNQRGTLIIHLGMSGSLRVLATNTPAQKHDHVDLVFAHHLLRLRDPRKFGAILWTEEDPQKHALLAKLGPEPLDEKQFNADYLYEVSRQRSITVKQFIMNATIVVGIGNIYASEALFTSGIHPKRAARNISLQRYQRLVTAIRKVLSEALVHGGTTLRDFTREDGSPGYFRHELQVYGRTKQPCVRCKHLLRAVKIGQRTSTYCPQCQR